MTTRKLSKDAGGMLAPATSRQPNGAPARTGGFRPYTTSPAMQTLRDRALTDQKHTLLSLDSRSDTRKELS